MKKHISLKDKIYIAGSTGMVGSAIIRSLKKNGYGNKKNSGDLLIPGRQELNLLDASQVNGWFLKNSPDVVILAAAKVGGILSNLKNPADFILQNLKIQTNVIEAAFNFGVRRFLFLGSSCIYPKFAEQPIKEEYLLSNKLESSNEYYAIAKIAGIKLCESLRLQYGFDAISLMPTNLYGPNDNYSKDKSHVMAALIRKFHEANIEKLSTVTCWGSGKPLREFLHVDDLGDAVVFALEYWDPDADNSPKNKMGKPLTYLNVGTGKDISIKDLAETISQEFEFKGNILWDEEMPDGTPRKLLNIDKFTNLGWSAKIDLTEGISSTIENFKKEFITYKV
tara:strand:- start:702 stop:1712 length:1011 start_codon:yes stop_codon:yes gene_type:complete